MKKTTLLYLEKDGCYLMLHRVKKKNDLNEGKWIGIGGHLEAGETPEECVKRECLEETGIRLTEVSYRGIVDFCSDIYEEEEMHLFTAAGYEDTIPRLPDGTLAQVCNEGILAYVPINEVEKLPLWEGDKVFLRFLAEDRSFFHLRLNYRGDDLSSWELFDAAE